MTLFLALGLLASLTKDLVSFMARAEGCGQPATISHLFIILLSRHRSTIQLNNNGEIGSLVLSWQPCSWPRRLRKEPESQLRRCRGHLPVSRTVSDSSARNARMAVGLGNMGGGGDGGRGSVGVIGGSRAALMSSRRKLESEVSLNFRLLCH